MSFIFSFLLLLIVFSISIFLWIAFGYSSIENSKTDILINWGIMVGTIISAIGLVYFSYKSYMGQKRESFITIFNTHLLEHNRLMSELFLNNEQKIKESGVIIISSYFSNKVYQGINDLYKADIVDLASKFYNSGNISRYFILLFRMLKMIDEESSLLESEKRKYTGMLRTLIPFEIQLIVGLNSLNNKEYKLLLEKYHFWKHLPLTSSFLMGFIKDENIEYVGIKEHYDSFSNNFISAILDEEIFNRELWKDNVYIK